MASSTIAIRSIGIAVALIAVLLAGCGGGGGAGVGSGVAVGVAVDSGRDGGDGGLAGTATSPSKTVESFPVGGKVQGLQGRGLVLQINDGEEVPITVNGQFHFPSALPDGSAYSIKVKEQPKFNSQICHVENGSNVATESSSGAILVACPPPAVGPTRFAYTIGMLPSTALGIDRVSAFAVDALGALSSIGTPLPTVDGTEVIEVDPSNRFVYIAGGGISVNGSDPAPATISAYRIGTDGLLTLIPGAPYTFGKIDRVMAVSIDPTGQFLYATLWRSGGGVYAFSIAENGSLTPVAGSPFSTAGADPIWGLAVDPAGTFVYANAGRFMTSFAIEANGSLKEAEGSPFFFDEKYWLQPTYTPVVVDPLGRFIFGGEDANLFSAKLNSTNGSLLQASEKSLDMNGFELAIDPRGRFAYIKGYESLLHVFAIDSSAKLTEVQGSPFSMSSIVTPDSNGKYLYVASGYRKPDQSLASSIETYEVDSQGSLSLVQTSTSANRMGLVRRLVLAR